MMFKISSGLKVSALSLVLFMLCSCAATRLSLEKKDLDVQTRTSNAIFLEPISKEQPLLFIDIRSGVMEFARGPFQEYVQQELIENGSDYRLTEDPDQADFFLMVSINNLQKVAPSAAEKAIKEGYGGQSLTHSLARATDFMEFNNHKDLLGAIAALIIVGTLETAINSSVKDTQYMLVCDVQVREKAKAGTEVKSATEIELKAGDAGAEKLTTEEVSDTIKYQTRIVTTANKANLKLETAAELMFKKTAYAIAGFFAK